MLTFEDFGRRNDRRFRASIYVDVFIPDSGDLEKDRERAEGLVKKAADYLGGKLGGKLGHAYVGGVASYNPHNLLNPLDKEI